VLPLYFHGRNKKKQESAFGNSWLMILFIFIIDGYISSTITSWAQQGIADVKSLSTKTPDQIATDTEAQLQSKVTPTNETTTTNLPLKLKGHNLQSDKNKVQDEPQDQTL